MIRLPIIIFLLILSTARSKAQMNISGSSSKQEHTWQRIVKEAKDNKKYILIDCYATWCGPCKKMDELVLSKEEIKDSIQQNFLLVKLQMDTTAKDGPEIKEKYDLVNFITKNYAVKSFPTYLFFDPSGKLVHMGLGYMNPAQFKGVLISALDTTRQYYTLLKKYRMGLLDYSTLPYLSVVCTQLNNADTGRLMALQYINNYLLEKEDHDILNINDIKFMTRNLKSSDDKSFNFFLIHAEKINQTLNSPNYSQRILNPIIYKEEIQPAITLANLASQTPDWDMLFEKIKRKYNRIYADRAVYDAKNTGFYQKVTFWSTQGPLRG